MRIKAHLDNTLYLSSLWADLSLAAELVIAEALSKTDIQGERLSLLDEEIGTLR